MVVGLEYGMELFGLLIFLYFFGCGSIDEYFKHTLKHGEGVVPNECQNLPLFSTLFRE